MTDRESIVADLRRMADDSQENRETFSPRALRELAERFERGEDKSKASMTDRVSSIIVYLKREADLIKEEDGPPGCNDMKAAMRTAYRSIAHQIECCADLKPAKPKATIADLLALHDLDLGALAHKVGVTMGEFTTAQVDALCDGFIAESQMDAVTWNMMCNMAGDRGTVARQIASTGAKVRAALSAPTIKVATPRILQSADEAPCGSLIIPDDDDYQMTTGAIRYPNGRWRHIYATSLDETRMGWLWKEHNIEGPVTVIADGLTEAECRHLSGLSAADAIAWCEKREVALRG